MHKRWRVTAAQARTQSVFVGDVTLSPLTATVLANRGLTTTEAIEQFLHPTLKSLADPYALSGVQEASSLLLSAIANQEAIVIYGDFDADGVTSTALLVHGLRLLGANVSYYIPHRYHEGYSLNKEAIDTLAAQGIRWMVTVDCGVSDVEEISYATEKGISVIVTDHHTPPEKLPKARVIIDPKCGDLSAPFAYLAGVGVAYKLLQGLYKAAGRPTQETEQYLGLVAIGTVADMAPLFNENRVLVFYGLQQLQQTTWPGLVALKKTAGIKKGYPPEVSAI